MKLYLCIMENTFNNNIHRNQIFPLTSRDKKIKVLFIAPLFILTRNGFSINRQKYIEDNVHHIRIPLLSYNFSMNPLLLPIFLLLTLPIVIYFVFKYKIINIHARNHLSSLVSVAAKKIKKNLIILSDFRGLYAEEGTILGRWKYNSFRYKIWKYIEKKICNNSDIVTTISKNMTKYISDSCLNNKNKIFFIPAIVDTNKFFFSPLIRKEFRDENKINDDVIVFLYVGSFGLWHDLPTFYKYIEHYIKKYNILKFKVFILSNIKRNVYLKLHDKYNATIKSVSPDLVNRYLCGSDIGILPGTDNSGIEYDLLYRTMISSKVEEYLSTGLKVIVNERIEEVYEMTKNDYKENRLIKNNELRIDIANKYKELFSAKKIKKEYRILIEGK